MFNKKARKIANLEAMVRNRDTLIEKLENDKRNLEYNIELLVNNLSVAKRKKLGL